MQAAFESGWLLQLFQSVAGFTKVGLFGIWFYESSDIHVYEVLIWVCEYTIN